MIEDLPLLMLERAPWYPRLLASAVRLRPWADQQVGCLWWVGAQSVGGQRTHERKAAYGSFNLGVGEGRRVFRTHVAVATAAGLVQDYRVPPGMNLDHTCREAVTGTEPPGGGRRRGERRYERVDDDAAGAALPG